MSLDITLADRKVTRFECKCGVEVLQPNAIWCIIVYKILKEKYESQYYKEAKFLQRSKVRVYKNQSLKTHIMIYIQVRKINS